ncbi:hypothetical protein HYDPIDRAFT_154977 [Hydnomerulius pinastri MD-312]|uniref:Pyridoxamine 5'-phosphate oxidase N-terminal domain-containing protein n=1 Tax=Hydnomerulius pinastri MD-312 TaxID=994086 RepID=A0A0C9VEK9_9AGAM|nr:hypothetical protein HYDPIDRAFT_154977 [Hydnomerulius pinastri MD-312]
MAVFYDEIPDKFLDWLARQQMFWVATAALQGHVNVSPKATPDCFHVLNKNQVWYEDLTGSGIETVSHMREPGNGRITILFHAFEGAPRILRMWGTGTVHEFGTPEYDALIPPEKRKAGSRAAIVIDVHKVATSCGFGVPQYQFLAHRSQLERFCDNLEQHDRASDAASDIEKKSKGIKAWWAAENTTSFDGLPALLSAHETVITPKNTYDRNAPRPKAQNGAKAGQVAQPQTQSGSGKIFDVKLLAAFSLGVMVTAAYVRVAGLRAP